MKRTLRDFLICTSLANLALMGAWRLLLDRNTYLAAAQPTHFLALILASALLSLFFWGGCQFARRSGKYGQVAGKWFFLQIVVLAAASLYTRSFLSNVGAFLIGAVFAIPILLLLRQRFVSWVATLLLVLVPCALFLFARAVWDMSRLEKPITVQGGFRPGKTEDARVLLLVFDELSEYVAFENRPAGVEMPAFDRLRSEALAGTAVDPPGNSTMVSLPSLLTGTKILEIKPTSDRQLTVHYDRPGQFEPFPASSTMFSDARDLGLGTAIIGWYHPYCSVLKDLDYCAHVKAGLAVDGIYDRGGVVTKFLDIASKTTPVLNRTNWATQRRNQAYRETHEVEDATLRALTLEALTKFRSGIMVVHLAVPHPPDANGPGMYFQNLVAADRALSDVRSAMERAGTWDSTTVIVTSDHGWRTAEWKYLTLWTDAERAYMESGKDPRVPFIVRLPDQHRQVIYSARFNAAVTRYLVHELLTQQIRNPAVLTSWLDLHRNDWQKRWNWQQRQDAPQPKPRG